MEAKKRWKKKNQQKAKSPRNDHGRHLHVKHPEIAGAVCLLTGSLLAGCSPGTIEMNSDLAGQVAIDVTGCSKANVENLAVTENDGAYVVTFNNEKGQYTIQVSSSGEVDGYQFSSGDQQEQSAEDEKSDEKAEQSGVDTEESEEQIEKSVEETKKSESDEQDNSDEKDKEADEPEKHLAGQVDLPEGSLPLEDLLQRAGSLISVQDHSADRFKSIEMVGENTLQLVYESDDGTEYTISIDPHTGSGRYSFVKK